MEIKQFLYFRDEGLGTWNMFFYPIIFVVEKVFCFSTLQRTKNLSLVPFTFYLCPIMLLAVDKPSRITSFDVIRIFKRHFPGQKI